MTMKELIDEVVSLPVEERALVADSILRSLNPPESDIDRSGRKWPNAASRNCGQGR